MRSNRMLKDAGNRLLARVAQNARRVVPLSYRVSMIVGSPPRMKIGVFGAPDSSNRLSGIELC
jgi:hypothetical protein